MKRSSLVIWLVTWEVVVGVVSGFSNRVLLWSFPWVTGNFPMILFPFSSGPPGSVSLSASGSRDIPPEESDEDKKRDEIEIDQARKQLESLLGPDLSSNDKDTKVDVDALMDPRNANCIADILPPQPPLTSSERDRRLMEIEILADLEDSDEPLQDLWDLWFMERGTTARDRLEQVDAFMSSGQVTAAESMLKQMIQDYGVYWVEPINRLATLMYLDGRFEESYQLCLVVLHLRPYHFGALSGIVAVCTAMRDREKARRWAEKRLPSLISSTSFPPFVSDGPKNPRRREWVQRAVQSAKDALRQLEFTKKSFGKPEKYYTRAKNSVKSLDETHQSQSSSSLFNASDDDAWQ
jgi:hypothetical protein